MGTTPSRQCKKVGWLTCRHVLELSIRLSPAGVFPASLLQIQCIKRGRGGNQLLNPPPLPPLHSQLFLFNLYTDILSVFRLQRVWNCVLITACLSPLITRLSEKSIQISADDNGCAVCSALLIDKHERSQRSVFLISQPHRPDLTERRE